jgi:hypothetical protein
MATKLSIAVRDEITVTPFSSGHFRNRVLKFASRSELLAYAAVHSVAVQVVFESKL